MTDAVSRQDYIVEELHDRGNVRISALAEQLGVSTMTIRRDLTALSEKGLATLVHGGARLDRGALFEYDLATKDTSHLQEKDAIASRCADMISDGMAIFLDAGTTVNHVARELIHKRGLTVTTGSLRVATTLAASENVNLIMAPGNFHHSAMATFGQMTDAFITQFHYDMVILSANGIDLEFGLSVAGPIDAATKRRLLDCTSMVVVVIDHSKFEQKQFTRICGLDSINVVITDDGLDEAVAARYLAAGVNLQRAIVM